MELARIAIENSKVTYFATFLVVVGGIISFFGLGQLEDPNFTIKTATVATAYPGASAKEVEQEVTDRIEIAIQEMPQVKYLESFSRAGMSLVKVSIKPSFSAEEIPQIWDELRRKVRDIESSLPSGAGRPDISDDMGQVFGFQLALIGDGFSYEEMEAYAKNLKRELSLVPGVARVDLWGVQQKVINVDVSQTQLTQLGISQSTIEQTLNSQSNVADAGKLNIQDQRVRIAPTGEFHAAQDIGELVLVPTTTDLAGQKVSDRPATLKIRDFATVSLDYLDPPMTMMRYNGMRSIGISLTNVAGANVVDVGKAIDLRLNELIAELPVGIEISRIHWQSDIVDEAVSGFLINFLEAVAIVLVVLTVSMGWRMGLIIGVALIATILASFIFLKLFNIDLQRMSLGAMIIALGMMVDNAIVVADGVVVRLQKGIDRKTGAIQSAQIPAMPLLGATIIAVLAFFPIFASEEDAGEYCFTLFTVVGISLLLSWIISVTLTPLQCMHMLPAPKEDAAEADPYASGFFLKFRALLERLIRVRWVTLGAMIAALAVSVVSFENVKQLFFPDSSMTKFMVNYWAPEGTRIQTVSRDLKIAESHILDDERVTNVSSFIGAGPPRFYLPVDPEAPYESYAQLIVNVKDAKDIPPLIEELDAWFVDALPQAVLVQQPYGVGPSDTWKFELRISGPSDAEGDELRQIAEQVLAILDESPLADFSRSNWRQRVPKIEPYYSQEKGRWVGVSRVDLANATKLAFDGRQVGVYRAGEDQLPIFMRYTEAERANVGGFEVLPVTNDQTTDTVPLSQITDGVGIVWEDPLIWRRDRRPTITVESNPVPGATLPMLRSDVLEKIESISLPAGYRMEWGGEFESTRDAQASLVPGVIPAVVCMIFIIVALFNAYKPPLIILATIPFVVIGITWGLLIFDTPFGFLALLGGMSLAGMMVKNAIVLLDEAKLQVSEGKDHYQAIIEATVSRLRPVLLATATTVLGVIPLLQDVFWVGLAVTVMAGLTFGTLITMVLVPVLYSILYKAHPA